MQLFFRLRHNFFLRRKQAFWSQSQENLLDAIRKQVNDKLIERTEHPQNMLGKYLENQRMEWLLNLNEWHFRYKVCYKQTRIRRTLLKTLVNNDTDNEIPFI